jgi:sulfide:quinone oxidoreductase
MRHVSAPEGTEAAVDRVLVLGGGIAGVEAAIQLSKKTSGGQRLFEVTLISERDYLYVYPISIWVPTGEKSFSDVCMPLSDLARAHSFSLREERVTSISAVEQLVRTEAGTHGYDHLVIAIGAGKMRAKGIENTYSICGAPEQALKLKEQLDTLIDRGSGSIAVGFGGNPKDTSAVRGGPAFEFLFNVEKLLNKRRVRDHFELTFFAPMPVPGARMGEAAVAAMGTNFARMGVATAFGKKIAEFAPDGVTLEDGSRILADLTMFISAGDGHDVLRESGLPLNEAGFVQIDDCCEVLRPEGSSAAPIYAIGDVAALEGPEWRAKQGHIAEAMARCAANNIAVDVIGGTKQGYAEHVNILCLMDMGNGGALVHRNERGAQMIPLPVVGHWMKKGWGVYYRNSKLGRIPRLPGM